MTKTSISLVRERLTSLTFIPTFSKILEADCFQCRKTPLDLTRIKILYDVCEYCIYDDYNNSVQMYHNYPCGTSIRDLPKDSFSQSSTFPFTPLVGAFHPYTQFSLSNSPDLKTRQTFLPSTTIYGRKSRGEKKPIPDDQKDDRYYERRKRNNQAAKKSRDARKLREDQIALRAAILEHENAILRTQLLTLREETESLRQIILSQKKPLGPFIKKGTKGKILDREIKWEPDFEFNSLKSLNKIVKV